MEFILVLSLLSGVGVINAASEGDCTCCNRTVVYHVASLQQTNHCCKNASFNNGGEIGDLKAQFAALQAKVQVLQNKLEKNISECSGNALINGVSPVKDNQLSASSTHGHCSLSRSRLYTQQETWSDTQPWAGSWCALTSTENQWIKVDFGRNVEITAIATQGRNTPAHPQWVTSYTLSVSNDGSVWMPYREESAMKLFGGNYDSDTVNKNYLKSPVRTRYLRLHPRTWHSHISLRWEVYGCPK